ncbi:MAG TPA: hypothetical protein VKY34_10275 [Xanthomarina sp.]|nr:hypothetical protein [Xanthomarina sp.]
MNSTIKNILSVIAGLVIGSIVNMGLITISGSIIPLPEGVDNTTIEGLKESMHLFQAKHFIFPFLAHALGTLVGAYLAAKIAATKKITFAMIIGFFFLAGGIFSVTMLPSPSWFSILDIVVAYIPMAWIGGKLAIK